MSTLFRNGVQYIYCPNCGEEMKANARCCMHCGYINYDNKANDGMKKYAKKAAKKPRFSMFKKKNPPKEEKKSSNRGFVPMKRTKEEERYRLTHNIIRLVSLIIVLVGGYYGYNFVVDTQKKYIADAEKIVEYAKKKVEPCGRIHYFKFTGSELNDKYHVKVKSPYTKEPYEGYVMIMTEGKKVNYYVAITDGTFGIKEKKVDELEPIDVLPSFGKKYDEITNTEC